MSSWGDVTQIVERLANLKFLGTLVMTLLFFSPGILTIAYYKQEFFVELDILKLLILAGTYGCLTAVPIIVGIMAWLWVYVRRRTLELSNRRRMTLSQQRALLNNVLRDDELGEWKIIVTYLPAAGVCGSVVATLGVISLNYLAARKDLKGFLITVATSMIISTLLLILVSFLRYLRLRRKYRPIAQ